MSEVRWLHVDGAYELKKCPKCGDLALEGQGECFGCGAEPGDDETWRELADLQRKANGNQ